MYMQNKEYVIGLKVSLGDLQYFCIVSRCAIDHELDITAMPVIKRKYRDIYAGMLWIFEGCLPNILNNIGINTYLMGVK